MQRHKRHVYSILHFLLQHWFHFYSHSVFRVWSCNEENCKPWFSDSSATSACLKDAPPVRSFATSWLHFLALCQRTGSCGVKEKEEQREKDREDGGRGDRWEGLLFLLLWFRERFIIKKDESSSTPSWPFHTQTYTLFLSNTKHKCQLHCQGTSVLWWKLQTTAHTHTHPHHLCIVVATTPAVCFSSLSLSINYSISAFNTTSIHHSFLSSSTHPSFLLSPSSILPSISWYSGSVSTRAWP